MHTIPRRSRPNQLIYSTWILLPIDTLCRFVWSYVALDRFRSLWIAFFCSALFPNHLFFFASLWIYPHRCAGEREIETDTGRRMKTDVVKRMNKESRTETERERERESKAKEQEGSKLQTLGKDTLAARRIRQAHTASSKPANVNQTFCILKYDKHCHALPAKAASAKTTRPAAT